MPRKHEDLIPFAEEHVRKNADPHADYPGPAVMAKLPKLFDLVAAGKTIREACLLVGWKSGQRNWYALTGKYPHLRAEMRAAQARRAGLKKVGGRMVFVEFRKMVLARHTFPHMKQWVEWFDDPEADHILILVPPECAKTTTVLDYILWRIYLDPNIRIGYVSRSLPHAIKQVSKVKNTLEQNATIHQLMGDPVPGPGDPHPWSASAFTIKQRAWTAGEDEADYTLAAFGSGSQITGSRFDLIIFDDPDDVNIGPADREKIWNVILQAGESRLGTEGRMIVIGNRQGEEDVYRMILDQHLEDPELWKVNVQKAIITEPTNEFPDMPIEVIWPEKYGRTKGMKGPIVPVTPTIFAEMTERAWRFFDMKRRRLNRRFYLIYQNSPISDFERDFPRELVEGTLNVEFAARAVPKGALVIATMDPAPVGGAAVVVYALLPPDQQGVIRRIVVDYEWGINWRTEGTWNRLRHYTETYRPRVWALERSALTRFLLDDPALIAYMRVNKAVLHEISTGANKNYGDFAVGSLRELLFPVKDGGPLLILPAKEPGDRAMTESLREQLIQYHPETTYPHDGPMALWFAERTIRDKKLETMFRRATLGQAPGWKNPYSVDWKRGGAWNLKPQPQPVRAGSLIPSDADVSKILPR